MIITIGRQTGSGGHIIAKKLAENLSLKFCDKELLDMAAMESGFSKKFFEQGDERRGFLSNLLHFSTHAGNSTPYQTECIAGKFSPDTLFQFQADAIRKAAAEGDCLFVGRCADYILRDHPQIINIFITANIDDRIQRLIDDRQYTPEQAARRIAEKEKNRAAYYNYYTGKKWGDAASYDLCVNSSLLGIDKTEEYIRGFVCDMSNINA